MAKYFFVFVLVLCLGIGSCTKKEDKAVNCANWTTEVSAQATSFSNAMITYSTSQTATNCTNLKSAGQAYVNALKTFTSCADTWGAATKTQWQTMVSQTESQLSGICK